MTGRVIATVIACLGAVTLLGSAQAQAPRNVVLVNQTFKCDNYPQPVDFDLVKVTVQAGTSRRFDGFHTGNCTGRIGRIEISTPFDGMKIQPGAHDLVIGGGYIHCLPVQGEVHQDGVQAMGGQRVTLRNVDIDCGTNSAMFINMGAGNQQLPTDIICDGCTMKKLSRNNRTLRIFESLRSGARNSTIYWCGSSCPGPAVMTSGATREPVNQGNTLVQYGTAPPPQPEVPQLTICANRATTFDLCWPAMTGVSRFNYYRDGSLVSFTNNGATVRVRFGKLVGTHRYAVGAVQAVGEGRSEVTVTR